MVPIQKLKKKIEKRKYLILNRDKLVTFFSYGKPIVNRNKQMKKRKEKSTK